MADRQLFQSRLAFIVHHRNLTRLFIAKLFRSEEAGVGARYIQHNALCIQALSGINKWQLSSLYCTLKCPCPSHFPPCDSSMGGAQHGEINATALSCRLPGNLSGFREHDSFPVIIPKLSHRVLSHADVFQSVVSKARAAHMPFPSLSIPNQQCCRSFQWSCCLLIAQCQHSATKRQNQAGRITNLASRTFTASP